MVRNIIKCIAAVLAVWTICGGAARADVIGIPLVTVGDPGNVADPATGYGAVPYVYDMGEYDVTMSQYTAFLNSVAATDPYGLYNSGMATGLPTDGITQTSTSAGYTYAVKGNGQVPVVDVSWGDAARFVNWLANGQPTDPEGPSTTETGTYALNGGTSNAALMAVTRSSTATWVLPSVNEWYKAAYYSGGGTNSAYWTYATQSNSIPSNTLSATGTNNANYAAEISQPPYISLTDPTNYLTPVGAFSSSPSEYGTSDQNGDAAQWLETPVGGSYYEDCGGSWASDYYSLNSANYDDALPDTTATSLGFRVGYVPEPSAGAIFAAAVALIFLGRQQLERKARSSL